MIENSIVSTEKKIAENFIFPKDMNCDTSLQMAQLITARLTNNSSSILVRVVVFIPQDGEMISNVTLDYDGDALNRYNFCVNYDQQHSSNETGYAVHYLQYELTNVNPDICEVSVYVNNKDPRTSRGTVTTVQTS